jgi:amidase
MGPLARDAADLALALDVVAGPDVGEDIAWRLALPPARHDRLADYQVAVLPWPEWVPLDNEIAAAWERLASDLGKHGARVATAEPEGFGDLRAHQTLYARLMLAQSLQPMPLAERAAEVERMRAVDSAVAQIRADVLAAGIADYLTWHDQREKHRAAYRAFFREWDVLLLPVTLCPAFPHPDGTPASASTVAVNGEPVPIGRMTLTAGIATLAGQPATAFPVGMTRGGLPIGLQAVGPYLEDHTSIRFAALVAQAFGGFRPPPGYGPLD